MDRSGCKTGIATSLHIPAVSAMEVIHDNTDTSTILVVHINLQQQRRLAAAAAFLTCTMYQLLRPPQHMIVNGTIYSSNCTLKPNCFTFASRQSSLQPHVNGINSHNSLTIPNSEELSNEPAVAAISRQLLLSCRKFPAPRITIFRKHNRDCSTCLSCNPLITY